MHKSAIVRSVYHNGGCHKNLPMYTGYDVNLPDEEFRDSDPPSMGSVCAYLDATDQQELPTYAYLPCPLGWGEVRKKAGPHGGFLGRRYDPFCTECTAYVDHPPDDIWRPQVVRGEPRLHRHRTARRHHARPAQRTAAGWSSSSTTSFASSDSRAATWAISRASSGWRSTCSPRPKCARPLISSREDDRTRDRYGRTLFGSSTLWPGGWSSAACNL